MTISWVTIAAGYALAATIFVLRLVGSDLPVRLELPGAAALAVVAAVPSTLALMGLLRRPVLVLPAGVAAVTALPLLSVFAPAMALVGIFWLWSFAQSAAPGSKVRKALITAVVWLLWAGGVLALFLHVDPRCVQTLTDGTEREVDAIARGYDAGWAWDASSTVSGSVSSGAGPDNVALEVCSSDVVTGWEAWATVTLSAVAVLAGLVSSSAGARTTGSTVT